MPKILIPVSELNDAMQRLALVKLDDGPHVDALELLNVARKFAGMAADAITEGTKSGGGLLVNLGDAPETHAALTPVELGGDVDLVELERARLDALPPGPCIGCKHVHPDESPCIECGTCTDYVDSTERDPIQSLGTRGMLPGSQDIGDTIDLGPAPSGGFDPRNIASARFVG